MTPSLEMLQTVEMVLDISPYDLLSADEILAQIARYIRKKRSVALDRVEFEEYRQDHGATFDEFYIGLQRIAKCADLCRHCLDQRMTTRVMSGICDQDVRKKLLAITPFPSLQTAVDLCRSEEAAGKKRIFVEPFWCNFSERDKTAGGKGKSIPHAFSPPWRTQGWTQVRKLWPPPS